MRKGKMNRICIFLSTLFLLGCSVNKPAQIVGTYKSTCMLYNEPRLIVNFYPNNIFVYNLPFQEKAEGNWYIVGDTLFLHSDEFQTSNQVAPSYKYTDLEGRKDAYIIRRGKLYAINNEGTTKICYLEKQ